MLASSRCRAFPSAVEQDQAAFECNSVCVPAQRASHKSAQGNALGLGISGTKSPNGADLNRFELFTAKISAAPLGLEIIAWKIPQGVALG